MPNTIESLEMEVISSVQSAEQALDALEKSLGRLKSAVKGGCGLTAVTKQLTAMNAASGSMNSSGIANLKTLADGLQTLSAVGKFKLSSSIANQITNLGAATKSVSETDFSKLTDLANAVSPLANIGKANLGSTINQLGKLPAAVQPLVAMDMGGLSQKTCELVEAVKPLSEMGKANLGSTLNQIKKLPEAFKALKRINMGSFAKKVKEVATALKPLADEMQKVSNGFSAFPTKIQKLLNSTNQIPTANKKASKSYANLAAKMGVGYVTLRRTANVLASWIRTSNDFVENLNLFNASMREYASEAQTYAETVGELMGIDPSDWMRNQGVFMTLATGFGVASDRAYTMSQNLTQLGYDLSSFFNITFEDAMQKLQSGLSGELEPLRRLGYDLSQARLEAIALSLGIDKTVSSMTQAEKAQLRYYAIMTQVTTAHGDMARTLDAPANQLRVLKAQITQAARALGNIFIPMLNAVLPYAIAIAKVIRIIANEIAKLLGFSLPEIDYSGLTEITAGAGDASEAVDSVTGSVKELKKTILGIDELNLMADNSDHGGAGSAGVSSASGFDFELPTYDFMGELVDNRANEIVDKILSKLQKLTPILKSIWDWMVEYKELVGLGIGLVAVGKLWKKLKNVWEKFAKLKIVSTFLDGFKTVKKSGGTLFNSIGGGLKNVRTSLTKTQKVAITAAAGFAEFTLVRESVKNLASGVGNVTGNLLTVGGAATIAATLMYTALGPAGIAMAAIVGITGAIIGIRQATEEAQRKMADEHFFSGVGVSLDTITEKLSIATEGIRKEADQISGWASKIEENNTKIDNLFSKIRGMSSVLGDTGVVTQEEIDALKGQFEGLYSAVEENMSNSAEIINTALVGALQNATPEISAQISTLIGEYQRYVRETQGKAAELKLLIDNGYDQLIGKQKDDSEYQEIMDNINKWYEQLGDLAGGMSDAGWEWEQMVNDINKNGLDIDLGGDMETAKGKINDLTETGRKALEAITKSRNEVLKQIDDEIRYAQKWNPEEVPMLQDAREAVVEYYAEQETEIKEQINSVFDTVQEDMIEKLGGVHSDLMEEWDRLGSEFDVDYAVGVVSAFQKNVDEVSSEIQKSMNDLGIDGMVWASEAIQTIFDGLFAYGKVPGMIKGWREHATGMRTDIDGIIHDVFDELEESGRKKSSVTGEEITKGLAEGVLSKLGLDKLAKSMSDMVNSGYEATLDAAQINSPSKLFAVPGGYMTEGVAKGISGKVQLVKDAVYGVIKSALSEDTATSYGTRFGNALGSAIAKALRNMRFPTITGTVSASGNGASIKFGAYASGGMVDAGQMFVAREAGPELVGTIGNQTAVVNNDQIVASVSQGVYEANGEQNALLREQNNLLRKLLEKDTNVTAVIGTGDVIGGFERKNRRDGRTVVPVGV